MSAEKTEKKPRKAAVKKSADAETAPRAKAAPKAKAKAAAAEVAVDASKVKQWPSHEEIAMLAHRYYEQRGWEDGFHEQDWFRAEQELLEAS